MASPRPTRYVPRSQAFSPCRGSQVGLTVTYPLAVITDVATDVCSSRARLRFASSTRIVVMCRMIEKGTMYAGKRTIGHWVNTEVGGSVCTTAKAWDAKNPVPTAPTKSSRPSTDQATGIADRRRPDQGDHGDAGSDTDCDVAERGWVGEEAGKLTADLQHQEHAS